MLPIQVGIEMPAKRPIVDKCAAISISHSSRAIYINSRNRFENGTVETGEHYERVRDSIISKLKESTSPTTGEAVLSDVLKREDVYWGPYLALAPDIVLVPDRYFPSLRVHSGTILNDEIGANDHALEGVFLAYGPDIKRALRITDAKIYDVAPTILHMFGLPVPRDMDGRVLREIFTDGSEVAQRAVLYRQPHAGDEKQRVKEKLGDLKGLGRL